MLVVLGGGGRELASGAGCLSLLAPVVESVPHFSDREIDHGDVFDDEQTRVVLDVLLRHLQNDVQVDTETEERRVDEQHVEQRPHFLPQ